MKIDLSIVVVSWNTREITYSCLETVYAQTSGIEFEVIVVDNASEDGSQETIKRNFPQVKLICNEKNVGFAAANNIGFKYCSGNYILLLNSDTLVLDSALQLTYLYACTKPDYGVVSCRVLNDDRSVQPNCFMFPSLLNQCLFVSGLYKIFPKNRFFGREEMTWWNYDDEREVEVIKGCFMLVKAEALKDVGGLDESFFMYSEEVDWCFRFHKKGWRLGFFPDAEIIHLGGVSAARLGADRALIKDKSSVRYMKKHWSYSGYAVGRFLMVLFYAIRLPIAIVLCVITGKEKYKKTLSNHWAGFKGLLLWKDA